MKHEHDGFVITEIAPWPGPVCVQRRDGRVAVVSREFWDGFCDEERAGPCHEQMADEWRTWWCVLAPRWKPADTPNKVP